MSAAVEILSELAERGVSVRADGNALKLRPAKILDETLLSRVREHKPEILAALMGLPTERCRACRSWLFWVSIHGAVTCAACHPPADRKLVKVWFWLPEGAGKTVQ